MTFLDELFSLADRVAVVTGGSSGIGAAMALALARARVVLVARDPSRLESAAGQILAAGGQAGWVSAARPPLLAPYAPL